MNTQLTRTPGVSLIASTGWQAADAAYTQLSHEAALRTELARRLSVLGVAVETRRIWADSALPVASVVVAGALVRLAHGQLTVVRPCDHCGCGAVASAPIQSALDLDRSLHTWRPLHADCEPFEADA